MVGQTVARSDSVLARTNDAADESKALAHLSRIQQMLAEATTLDEVKAIRDQAEALRTLAKKRGFSLRVLNQVAESKLRTERLAGSMLAAMEKHGGGRPSGNRLHDATSLSEIGIEKTQSHRWQRIASIPEAKFDKHIATVVEAQQELTTAGVLSLAKAVKNAKRNGQVVEQATSTSDLAELIASGQKFGTIYADPPWQYGNQATRAATDNHYPTMTPDEIAALPVEQLAADDAHLHLWTTNAFLFECQRIMEAWGFTYKSVFVWVKPQMGIGNYWRVSHEFLLLGIRGECPFLDHGQMSWREMKRTGHSTKPEEVRKTIEKVSPVPRLEMFGRRLSDGWTVWGNQISRTMFDAEAVAS